jgi:hypothetical protein
MKFSIIAVALLAAIVKAAPVPDVDGSTGVDITAPATTVVAPDSNEVRPIEDGNTLTNPDASKSGLLTVSTMAAGSGLQSHRVSNFFSLNSIPMTLPITTSVKERHVLLV